MHGVDHIAARGMMIGMVAVPVATQFLQVEIVALYGLFATLNDFDGSIIECDGSQPRQGAQALLAAGITGIDLHVIDMHRHSAESTNCVHYKKRPVSVR